MSISLALLQTISLCLGHSASPILVCTHEEAEMETVSVSENREGENGRGDRYIGETVMHPYSDYIQYLSVNQSIPNSEMGNYELLIMLSFLDFFKSDSIVSETNDWVVTLSNNPNIDDQSPSHFAPYYSNTWLSWIANYASSKNISYSIPQGTPYNTYEYFYYFLGNYLLDAGYTQTTSTTPGDFELAFFRANYWAFGAYPSLDLYASDLGANAIINAINNGWLAVFNLSYGVGGTTVNRPFIAVGYTQLTVSDYSILAYNPYDGTLAFTSEHIHEVTILNFHGTHVHSNNLRSDSPYLYYCGCGYELCRGSHSYGSATSFNWNKHRYYCANCDYYYEESHEFHYEWKNATKHRKYCSICNYSILENHSGTFCICQLGDYNGANDPQGGHNHEEHN